MRLKHIIILAFLLVQGNIFAKNLKFNLSEMGLKPDTNEDCSQKINEILIQIKAKVKPKDKVTLNFAKGKYNFYPESSTKKIYYISNHDQTNPKNVGIALEGWNNLTLNGNGSEFIFHGTMLPISLIKSDRCTLENFNIDFKNPHISQIEVIKNDGNKGITFRVEPWVNFRITPDSVFETYGRDWQQRQNMGIAFEKKSRHIVYNTSDISINTKGAKEIGDRTVYAPNWKDSRLMAGTIVAMRSWERPTPGIFLSHDNDTKLLNVTVHYSQGMGLLAQLCDNITMEGFNVKLKGNNDPRYFTTQADATHFSQCKGQIISNNGLYEGMMDDAINIHGTYLRVIKKIDNYTLVGKYMHNQAYGFTWGYPGDKVHFIKSKTMDLLNGENEIEYIRPGDKKTEDGAKEFMITFKEPITDELTDNEEFGIENITWTPDVTFSGNTIRNNRARGALFSTPKKVLVTNNIFDHTSGSAILLCGDCNGWFETGACRDVLIKDNKFINALTNMFQFTNAVVSIYPEIPDLKNQKTYFHGGKKGAIQIIDNEFDTFDTPLLYAKSVNGIVFKGNRVIKNNDYKPFHWNKERVKLEWVTNAEIE